MQTLQLSADLVLCLLLPTLESITTAALNPSNEAAHKLQEEKTPAASVTSNKAINPTFAELSAKQSSSKHHG